MEDQRLMPLHDIESLDKPRQFLPKIFRQNGAIYVAHAESFLAENSFFIPPVMPFMMSREESVDIDNAFDLFMTEEIISHY
jgi:CMP-N-acetylneuraminic acid synthetase